MALALKLGTASEDQPQVFPKHRLKADVAQGVPKTKGNLRRRALLTTNCAVGLSVTETCRLKIADVGSERVMLRVSSGNDGMKRYTLLSTGRRCWTCCAHVGAAPVSIARIITL